MNHTAGNLLTQQVDVPFNEVIVERQSDFGPVGVNGKIRLVDKTVYKVAGQVLMFAGLELPDRSEIELQAGSYSGMNELVFIIGAADAICTDGQAGILHIINLNVTDATGFSRLIVGIGDGSFTEQSVLIFVGGTVTNFGSFGDLTGYFTVVIRRVFVFETGKLSIDNIAAFTVNAFLWKNFTTKGQMFDLRTNVSQAAFTEVALIPAKNDEPLNIDPAMIAESGISMTLIPYNGLVFVNSVNFADNLAGGTTVTTAIGHSFDNGDYVFLLSGTYAGVQLISNVVNKQADATWGSVGLFDIATPFVGNDLTRPITYLFDISTLLRYIQPFFKSGFTGTITAISDNGSGFARVTSIAHGRTTGESLYISGTVAYDGGYYAIVIDIDNFDLLDSFGQPVPYSTPEITGSWNTSSLDQTNNILAVQNTGGIIPDSQSLGNNIMTTTIEFISTTILTRVTAGTWVSDESERFKFTSDGRLIYIGKADIIVTISAKVTVQKQQASPSVGFMNIMHKTNGDLVFSEVANHPTSQARVQNDNPTQLTVPAIVESVSPGDEFGIGLASDSSFTMDVYSIDFNIKK